MVNAAVFKKAPVYRLGEREDDPAKTLAKLLKANHESNAVLRNPRLLFHNHVPHALGSSYLLGADSARLEEIYAAEKPNLYDVNSDLVRHVITRDNWRQFLGQKKYTAAYVDYFDAEIERVNGDWKKVVEDHLYLGTQPLVNSFCGGLGHPFIHLAYGYEFNSKEVIAEALSLGCTEYDQMHAYLDTPPPDTSTYKTRRIADVLENLRNDKRFANYTKNLGFANMFTLFGKFEPAVREHFTSLIVDNADEQLLDWLQTAAALATTAATIEGGYDFYIAHILTVGHALRILMPYIPEEHKIPVMKQFGLFAILVYLMELTPSYDPASIRSYKAKSDGWKAIYQDALASQWFTDVHWSKVVRALNMVEEVRGSEDEFYKKAADKFIREFEGWTGFGLGVDAIP
ncbi:unnamed protein product [Clonostachys byssicola]|uniref:MGS207 protein n=1 Tax=Clonostachys byssicola TaxID=160290 RepID=A0A9N9UY25_9HYPO|nr:unnamed protein product [Clonostachys byssicola]